MAVITVPNGCFLQPNDTETVDTNGKTGYTVDVKGLYSSLKTWKDDFVLGVDTLDGKIISETSLRRVSGDAGVLTITLNDSDAVDGSGDSVAYKGCWSFKALRNDVSILAYCGDAASRVKVELWQKETDADLADEYKYRDENGTEVSLSDKEKAIAEKIRSGRETIIRFYPLLTYTAYYKRCPKNWATDIGLIRTPAAAAADNVIAPDNINSVISGFVWLKIQDDIEEIPENGFKRTMSWWGISSEDGGWDADFYGSDRWTIPLQ